MLAGPDRQKWLLGLEGKWDLQWSKMKKKGPQKAKNDLYEGLQNFNLRE